MNAVNRMIEKPFNYITILCEKAIAAVKCKKGQFALDIAIGLAIVLVISAFIVLPSLKNLSNTFFTDMGKWWSGTMSSHLFSTSGN